MKNIALLLMLLSQAHCISGQSNLAELDAHSDIHAGENITIKSKFSTLPVVEPHISAHPGNNNHLLVAAMVVTDVNNPYESCRLSSFVSTDGGKTWQETAHDWWGYDPWTAILPNGNTVMTWLGTEQKFKGQFPLQFFTSYDGGVSWSKNVQTISGAGHGHDGTKVTAYNNEFYFTTVRFNSQMGADVVLYRKDGSDEFKEVAVVDSKGARLNFCEPAILIDGTVIVPSSHFMEKLWVQQYNHKLGKLSDKTLVTIKPGGAGGYMRMTADISATSKYKDRIYLARALGRNSDYQGVWINYSHDKGQTWSKDTRIDLFDNKLESRAIVPSIAVNKDGWVGISWVDSQQDIEQNKKDVYFTVSKDGGGSFQRPVRVTDVSSTPRTAANADVANKFSGGGHYLGIAAKLDGSFQLVWSDSRDGLFELQTCNVEIRQ